MTVINHQPLKISDKNGHVLSVHDDRTLPGEPVTVGADVRVNGARMSVGIELEFQDAVRLRDELNRLVKQRIARKAARSVPVT